MELEGWDIPTAAEVAQTFRQSLQNKHKEGPAGFVSIVLDTLIPTKKWGNSCQALVDFPCKVF
jgi:hypothetical protein